MPKLLIADDKVENRYVLINFLRLLGTEISFDIREADSARQCLEILENEKDFDLIFLDVKMETDDAGLEAVRQIRTDDSMPDIEIWAITARALTGDELQTSDKDKCLNAGYNDYISKPFEPSTLLLKVSNFFNVAIPDKVKQKLGIA